MSPLITVNEETPIKRLLAYDEVALSRYVKFWIEDDGQGK